MTLQGGAYEFEEPAWIAITGGDFDCSHPMWRAAAVKAGDIVRIGGCRSGARAYLCARGGLDVERILGSASTHLLGGFGRALRKGDALALGTADAVAEVSAKPAAPAAFQKRLRVTAGAQAPSFQGGEGLRFAASAYRVRDESNRMGIRLEGPRIASPFGGQMASEGVPLGAVQIPSNGEPLILFVDAQTTGGYPVIASVVTADHSSLGQLRPRDEVRFEPVTMADARRLLDEQEAWIGQTG